MPAEAAGLPPLCLPPAAPRPRPGFRLPQGSCDTHIHVFGAAERCPLVARRDYTPVVASLDDYGRVMDAYGIARAVLVQPSVYGTDNTLLLDTLAIEPERLRGIVVIPPDLSDSRLRELDRAGVRGVRFNRLNQGGLPLSAVDELGRRIARLGWHIQLHVAIEDTPDLPALAARAPVAIVIDHFGLASLAGGPGAPGFVRLLRPLEAGHCYVKLSAPYRLRPTGASLDCLRALVEKLVATRPDRLLWGTDWPHVACWPEMPDDGDLALLTEEWLPTSALRQAVLVTNPACLYWGAA